MLCVTLDKSFPSLSLSCVQFVKQGQTCYLLSTLPAPPAFGLNMLCKLPSTAQEED
jgi:hypothetical protein